MEQVYYCGGWVEGAKSLRCQDFADRETYRTGGARCIKWAQTVQNPTDRQVDERQTKLVALRLIDCGDQ